MEGNSVSLKENVVNKAIESDQLKCKHCSRRFVYEKSLLEHTAEHVTPFSKVCHVCGKIFDQRNNYHKHMRTHLNVRKFQCDRCFATFKSSGALHTHRWRHSSFIRDGFRCSVCDKIFNRKKYLDNHMRIHIPENQERVQCRTCGAHVRKMNFKVHLQRHSVENRYACSVCYKRFALLSELNSHYNIHTGDTHYECEICDYKTYHKHNLSAHMVIHSLETQKHTCSKCQKVYKRKTNLNRHLKLHKTRKPYQCRTCEQAFTSSYYCRIHEDTHSVTEKMHQCNQCQRSYISKQRLRIHIASHKKPFVCGICNRSFRCQAYLTRHIKVHSNENVCQICNKSFHNLAKHMTKHKRQTIYECEECNFVSFQLKTYKDACKHIQEKLPRCQLCRRIFLTENGLHLHMKRLQNLEMECHRITKPKTISSKKIDMPKPRSKCQECNIEFNDMYSYRQHMESHDPNKQFCCEYCHERFYSFTKLYKHLGKH